MSGYRREHYDARYIARRVKLRDGDRTSFTANELATLRYIATSAYPVLRNKKANTHSVNNLVKARLIRVEIDAEGNEIGKLTDGGRRIPAGKKS